MPEKLKAIMEGVICLYDEQGSLVAVIRKPNGHVVFHKTADMGFSDIGELLGADMPKSAGH